MDSKARERVGSPVDLAFWSMTFVVLLVGLFFRLPGLSDRSLWIDELYSEWFASRSFAELWWDVPLYETHPPVYYTLLKIWTLLFGDSELGLRSFSLVASLATILAVAAGGRLLCAGPVGKGAGMLGACLLAVNFANIREAQNARPYSLQAFVWTLAILAALTLVKRLSQAGASARLSPGWLTPALMLGLCSGLGLWVHNTGLFIALGLWTGLALSLFFARPGQRLRNFAIFAAAGALAVIVWTPYLPLFIAQSHAFMGIAFWLTPKTRDLYSAWMLLLGENWPALLLSLTLLALGLFRLFKIAPQAFLVAAAVLFVPLYLVLALSFTVKPIYIQRLFAWVVPLALLIIALGIVSATRLWWPRFVLAGAAIAVSAFAAIQDRDRPIDDWKAIVAEIARNAEPNDVVIAVPAEGSIAVDYYARRQAHFPPVACVPGCYPQRNLPRVYMVNLGAPKVIEADREIVDRLLRKYDRVWLVQVSVALYDPKSIIRSRIASSRTFVRYYGNSLARVDLFE